MEGGDDEAAEALDQALQDAADRDSYAKCMNEFELVPFRNTYYYAGPHLQLQQTRPNGNHQPTRKNDTANYTNNPSVPFKAPHR